MRKKGSETVEGVVVEEAQTLGKTAVEAVNKGAAAARQAVSKVAISPVKLVGHAVYGACYGIAYGAVYSSMIIGKALPTGGAISKGLHDGAETAIKDFEAARQVEPASPEDFIVNA